VGQACVKNLPLVGVDICTKIGGDWSGGSSTKEVHGKLQYRDKQSFLYID